MKKAILILLCAALPGVSLAAGGEHVKLNAVKIDLNDKASLQRGARTFVNYCLSCHSMSYMRYNRMGQDLGISEELVKENLLFAADKTGALMKAVMPRDDAKRWFGTAPPDLSLVARSRGPEWFYTYMLSFYRDDRSPSGWNNVVFPHVAMPNVLFDWQGQQRAVYRTEQLESVVEKDGKKVKKLTEEQVFDHFEIEKPGTMSSAEYEAAMRDLTNFMVYAGEPAKLVRYHVGIGVLVFLGIFFVFAYLLKKEYWKDVH
jgi:ubiquinol-cytochrome c reductase cytochrome c1 subunit